MEFIMAISHMIKSSLILGTVLTIIHQWPSLSDAKAVDWLALLLCYLVSFLFTYWLLKDKKDLSSHGEPEMPVSVDPKHVEALYKQASLVERNAHKANAVFTHQLQYIKKLLANTRNLDHGTDYDVAHANLVKELSVLEHHVELIVSEMNKNVKLGEKLQQSVANIDPEIRLL